MARQFDAVCLLPLPVLQYAAKAGPPFGRLMFASEPGSAADDLAAALRWAEGQVSSEGPFFLGKEFSLVSSSMCNCAAFSSAPAVI